MIEVFVTGSALLFHFNSQNHCSSNCVQLWLAQIHSGHWCFRRKQVPSLNLNCYVALQYAPKLLDLDFFQWVLSAPLKAPGDYLLQMVEEWKVVTIFLSLSLKA